MTTPAQLVPHLEKKIQVGRETRDLVEMILLDSTQPMTVIEIREKMKQLGRRYDQAYIRMIVNELVAAGKISGRMETQNERFVRANHRAPRGNPGMLYFAPAGEVPARTEVSVVDGLILDSENRHAGGRRKKLKKLKKQRQAPVLIDSADRIDAGSISNLIEILVQERTEELRAKLKAAETTIAQIRKLIS